MNLNEQEQPSESEVITETEQQESTQNESEPSDSHNETTQDSDSDSSASEQENNEEIKQPETPEWFMKDKYKTIEEQAKASFELQKKMGKFWGSPQDDYKVDGLEGIEENDPLIAALSPALKEMGLSQDGFNHLVNQYMNANRDMVKELEENLKKTLTTTDAHTYQSIEKWMNDNLTPQEAMLVKNNWLMSAEDFKLFNTLRLMAAPNTNVPSGTQNAVAFESSQEVLNDKIKYKTEVKTGARVQDKNYENELSARYRDAKSREYRQKSR